jgi:hypothetical protein
MNDRYHIKEVATKTIHDVLTELETLEGKSEVRYLSHNWKYVDFFIDHLSGSKNVLWKYAMLVKKLSNRYEVFDIFRYRSIIQVLYPNRTVSYQSL